jgi:hypothetical protein
MKEKTGNTKLQIPKYNIFNEECRMKNAKCRMQIINSKY